MALDNPPTVIDAQEVQPVPADSAKRIGNLTQPFIDSLDALDAKRGSRLGQIFRECLEMHDQNAQLRANLAQMQTLLQVQFKDWVEIRTKLGGWLDNLKATDTNFHEKVSEVLDLNERVAKTTREIARAVREVKEEIRKTEFGDRFHIHISIVQQFVNGMKAILYRHLQDNPKLEAIMGDIRRLAKIFDMQEKG